MAVRVNSVVRLLISLVLLLTCVWCRDCVLKTPCSCDFDDGSGTVDLTSLGHTDNTPAFKDVLCSDENYYYSYNPCGGFSEADCSNAAACVLDQDKSESQQIGDAGRGAFKFDDESGNVLAAYTSGSGVLKLTMVTLICDPHACDPTLTAQGEQHAGQFELTLKSICACPGKCSASGPPSCSKAGAGGGGGLSGGSILLIVFFTVVVVYFMVGALVSKYVRKKEGKEIVPNYMFWRAIPIHIKTGVIFTLGLCIPSFRRTTYAEI